MMNAFSRPEPAAFDHHCAVDRGNRLHHIRLGWSQWVILASSIGLLVWLWNAVVPRNPIRVSY